jgi:type VI secretion system secreted protein Hcp
MSFEFYVTIKGSKQGQFKSETKKEKYSEKHIPCMKIEMGSVVPVDANSGELKGFRMHKPLVITKEWGASSPQILQAHWSGEVLDEVVVTVVTRSADGMKEEPYEVITLKDAKIVSVNRYSDKSAKDTSDSDVNHLEDIGFRFRAILVENPQAGTSTSDDWDKPHR